MDRNGKHDEPAHKTDLRKEGWKTNVKRIEDQQNNME